MLNYIIAITDADVATLVKLLARENAVREEHNAKMAKGEVAWKIIPDARAYAEQVVQWHAEAGAKALHEAARKAALAKVENSPETLTAEDKAVLGIQ